MNVRLSAYSQLVDSNSNWPMLSNIKEIGVETTSKLSPKEKEKEEENEVGKLGNFELIEFYLKTKEEKAWEEFYNRFNKHIESYVRKTLNRYKTNKSLAQTNFSSLQQDLVQEVYLRLLKNNCKALQNYTDKSQCFYAYLHKVAVNTVIDYFRQLSVQKRQGILISLDTFTNSSKDSSLDSSIARWDSTLLKCEIEDLLRKGLPTTYSKRNKRIFLLFTVLGLNAEEIVESFDTDLTCNIVENVIRQTRNSLKQLLTTPRREEQKTLLVDYIN